jgi:hypothetical protein
VPLFSRQELPGKQPAASRIFSLGEETSESYPFGVSWSSPGLAKHRRCALAVHTTNLVLSLWASEGKPEDETSWDRRLILNDTLEDYFSEQVIQNGEQPPSQNEDRIRVRKRIRAFAWAPAMQRRQQSSMVGTQLYWDPFLMAVSNDDNQVIILAVNSPTSTYGIDDVWSATVCTVSSIRSDDSGTDSFPGIFEEMMERQGHISYLAWSPWIIKPEGCQSVLAYATNEHVRFRVVKYSTSGLSVGPEVVYPNIELRFAGPMSWSPRIGADDMLTLALFTSSEVICLTISATDASIVHQAAHDLDGRWDTISGVAWDINGKNFPRLHFASQNQTTRCPTAALEVTPTSLLPISRPGWPYWREHISGSQGHFSAEHELKGNANAKVWGLCTSPLGDYIVSCHTLHPTDMIEYGVQADRRCNIAVSLTSGRGSELKFPNVAVSAESIFSTVRKWIESNVETYDELPSVKEEIYKKLMHTYSSPHRLSNSVTATEGAVDASVLGNLLTAFKQDAFLDPNTLKDRYEILASYICTPAEAIDLPKILIAFRLAKQTLYFASTVPPSTGFSKSILKSSRHAIRLIQELISPDISAEDHTSTNASSISVGWSETCTFCDAPIHFLDPFSASCVKGHKFVRCGLSFLTIQAPGCSKYCGICKSPYLSDDYIAHEESRVSEVTGEGLGTNHTANGTTNGDSNAGAEMGDGISDNDEQDAELTAGGEPPAESSVGSMNGRLALRSDIAGTELPFKKGLPVTLARVLYLACDACVYCGGKFVG